MEAIKNLTSPSTIMLPEIIPESIVVKLTMHNFLCVRYLDIDSALQRYGHWKVFVFFVHWSEWQVKMNILWSNAIPITNSMSSNMEYYFSQQCCRRSVLDCTRPDTTVNAVVCNPVCFRSGICFSWLGLTSGGWSFDYMVATVSATLTFLVHHKEKQ